MPINNNPETLTPGSAVADTLQNILAQQRANKHQQIVDSISALNTQSDMNYRAQQAQSEAENREAQAAQRKALTAKAVADASANDTFNKYLSGLDPSQASPSMALDIARHSPNGEMMKSVIPAMMAAPGKEKGGDIQVLDRNGNINDSGVWDETGTKVVTQPAPQQPNAADVSAKYDITEQDPNFPNDPTKTIVVPHWLRPREQPTEANRIKAVQANKGHNPNPPPTPKVASLYDKQAFNAYKSSLQSPNSTAQEKNATMINLINSVSDSDPKEAQAIKDDVNAIVNHDQARTMKVDDLVKNGSLSGTPDHIRKVKEMLGVVRGF